jgi:6-pyruvoyl-tetrahydropterin synthase
MGSLYLSIRKPFVADHFHDLPGFVEERHGHNWEAEATFAAGPGGAQGPARSLEAWVEGMDYSLLNAQPALEGRNPTAELLAQDLFTFLERQGQPVVRVKIREKANYWAACSRDAR